MAAKLNNVINALIALAVAALLVRIVLGVLNVSSFLTFYNSSYLELCIVALLFAIVLTLIQIRDREK